MAEHGVKPKYGARGIVSRGLCTFQCIWQKLQIKPNIGTRVSRPNRLCQDRHLCLMPRTKDAG